MPLQPNDTTASWVRDSETFRDSKDCSYYTDLYSYRMLFCSYSAVILQLLWLILWLLHCSVFEMKFHITALVAAIALGRLSKPHVFDSFD